MVEPDRVICMLLVTEIQLIETIYVYFILFSSLFSISVIIFKS